jgi:hypothetical protein
MAHEYDLRRGGLYIVASALLFALMSVAVKIASATLPNVVVVFFRSGFGLLTLIPFIVGVDLRTTQVREHLIRSLAGIASMYCFFYTLAHMRLADAVLLNYSLPIFIPFVESVWLGEEFPGRLWIPVAVGFAGVIVILRPGSGLMEPVALLGVASALFAAVAQVGVRRLTRTEPVTRIVFYFAITPPGSPPRPRPCPGGRRTAGVVGRPAMDCRDQGQLAMTRAYAHAPLGGPVHLLFGGVRGRPGLLAWRTPRTRHPGRGALVGSRGALPAPQRGPVETPGPATV